LDLEDAVGSCPLPGMLAQVWTRGLTRGEPTRAPGDRVDWIKAQGRAKSMRGFKNEHGKSLLIHAPLKDLGRAGTGIELFFRTLRWLFIVLVIATCLGCVSLAANLEYNKHVNTPIVVTTIGPCCKTSPSELRAQSIPWFITFLLFLLFLYWLRYKQRQVAHSVDRRYITTGDYSVEVRNIPLLANESALYQFFEQYGRVSQVQIGFRCSGYVRLFERWKKHDVELAETRVGLALLAEQGHALDSARAATRAAKIDTLQNEMIDLESEMARLQAVELISSGAAFVIFETEAGRRACLKAHHLSAWTRFLEMIGWTTKHARFGDSVDLSVVPAPEPSDVFWENLEVGPHEVRKRSLYTLLVAMGMIGTSLVLLLLLTRSKDSQIALLKRTGATLAASTYTRGVSLVAAVVVTAVNSFLRIAINQLTVLERHDTKSDYEESYFIKLSLAYVLNQSLLILIVSPNPSTWFVEGGVYAQAFYIILANAIVPELFKVVRLDTIFKRYVMGTFVKSQAKLEELWQPPEASLGEFYAGLLKTVTLGLLYAPAMPVVWFITTSTIIIKYWSTKYALLRVCRQPPTLDEGLSEVFRELLSFVLLGSVIIEAVVLDSRLDEESRSKEHIVLPIAAGIMWLIYKIVPLQRLGCLRNYVDNRSNDTGGKVFSSLPGLARYRCPISQPVPSLATIHSNSFGTVEAAPGGVPSSLETIAVQMPSAVATPSGPMPERTPSLFGSAYEGNSGRWQITSDTSVSPAQYPQPAYELPVQPQSPPRAPPMLLAVTCPENVGPGAQLIVQGPSGQMVTVTVPSTVFPGMIFHVSV